MAYTKTSYPEYTGSAAIAGKKFLLYVAMTDGENTSWKLLGGQKDTGLEITSDSIDASSKGNGAWGEQLQGQKSWSSSPSVVCKTDNEALDFIETWVFDDDIQNDRPALHFAFVNAQTKSYYDSWGTVASFSYSGSYDDVLTVDLEINGVAALTKRDNFDAATIVTD